MSAGFLKEIKKQEQTPLVHKSLVGALQGLYTEHKSVTVS